MSYAYTIKLDASAYQSLLWIADRYTSAEILVQGSDYDEDAGVLSVPEHVAWEYAEALPGDNGVENACLPPCAGGPLAEALLDFLGSIV